MKSKYLLIGILAIVLVLAGCGSETDENVVDDLSDNDSDSVAVEPSNDVEDNEETTIEDSDNLTTEEMIQQAYEDAGLIESDEDEEETITTSTTSNTKTISIENFRGNPEDLTVNVGDTVTWKNLMYFKNIIILLPSNGDNTYDDNWINDLEELWYNESYEFTFNESGEYKWGSKTKFDKTNGIIIVNE